MIPDDSRCPGRATSVLTRATGANCICERVGDVRKQIRGNADREVVFAGDEHELVRKCNVSQPAS
jgi:hypothetical protein